MSGYTDVQWFPGHMTKTKRQMQKALPLTHMVAEILDARIPYSSQNPDLKSILGGKPRIVLLNKSDAADPAVTARWIKWFAGKNIPALAVECNKGKGINQVLPLCREVLKDRIAVWEKKGMGKQPIRVMVVGIPNVGKSSLINRLSRGAKAKVADKPGVTRGNQWFSFGKAASFWILQASYGPSSTIPWWGNIWPSPALSRIRWWTPSIWRAASSSSSVENTPTG